MQPLQVIKSVGEGDNGFTTNYYVGDIASCLGPVLVRTLCMRMSEREEEGAEQTPH